MRDAGECGPALAPYDIVESGRGAEKAEQEPRTGAAGCRQCASGCGRAPPAGPMGAAAERRDARWGRRGASRPEWARRPGARHASQAGRRHGVAAAALEAEAVAEGVAAFARCAGRSGRERRGGGRRHRGSSRLFQSHVFDGFFGSVTRQSRPGQEPQPSRRVPARSPPRQPLVASPSTHGAFAGLALLVGRALDDLDAFRARPRSVLAFAAEALAAAAAAAADGPA